MSTPVLSNIDVFPCVSLVSLVLVVKICVTVLLRQSFRRGCNSFQVSTLEFDAAVHIVNAATRLWQARCLHPPFLKFPNLLILGPIDVFSGFNITIAANHSNRKRT